MKENRSEFAPGSRFVGEFFEEKRDAAAVVP